MLKKTSKFLFTAALVGAAVAGGIAYLNRYKKDAESPEEDFDEFQDDFQEDLEEEDSTASREYVTIHKEEAEKDTEHETEEDK